MKEKILEDLRAATDEIFLEWQAKLHVMSGDVSPMNGLAFDQALERLTDVMVDIINNQPKLDIANVVMKDGTVYDADKLADSYEVFQALMTVRDHIKETH